MELSSRCSQPPAGLTHALSQSRGQLLICQQVVKTDEVESSFLQNRWNWKFVILNRCSCTCVVSMQLLLWAGHGKGHLSHSGYCPDALTIVSFNRLQTQSERGSPGHSGKTSVPKILMNILLCINNNEEKCINVPPSCCYYFKKHKIEKKTHKILRHYHFRAI